MISFRKRTFIMTLLELTPDSFEYSFINTVAGWINLLLLSSSGPIKIPVGAWYVLLLLPADPCCLPNMSLVLLLCNLSKSLAIHSFLERLRSCWQVVSTI